VWRRAAVTHASHCSRHIAEAYAVLSDPQETGRIRCLRPCRRLGLLARRLFDWINFDDIFGGLGFYCVFDRLFRRRAAPRRGESIEVTVIAADHDLPGLHWEGHRHRHAVSGVATAQRKSRATKHSLCAFRWGWRTAWRCACRATDSPQTNQDCPRVIFSSPFARPTIPRTIETVDVVDAVLETNIEVPTVEGRVTAKVPGTQPDTVLRLRGKGLLQFGGGTRGDLYVRLQAHIP
jgi:hypothetical protein